MAILVQRAQIGIFGKMNAGKSSLMNLLTQQETSLVDKTPGTTADTKITLQEIHGLGPVKLFDTAGADEQKRLGAKKRQKIFADLKECDLVLVVIDTSSKNFVAEKDLIFTAREADKQILIIYNLFEQKSQNCIASVEKKLKTLQFYPKITINVLDINYRKPLLDFILKNFVSKNQNIALLPFLKPNAYYLLIIPMDEETPPGRYLRPQAMVEEYITRHWAWSVSFRLDLGKARSSKSASEKKRFETFLANFQQEPLAMITDSQAMDIMSLWCPKNILLTTFSIVMINYFSRGRLNIFARGIHALETLKTHDKILIVEACNHSRIGEDIGTVQIPDFLQKNYPGIVIEHNFGREFYENEELAKYKLIIHCGGCMISSQKLIARIRDLQSVGVPFTNYGIFLAYMQGREALVKVLEPWQNS